MKNKLFKIIATIGMFSMLAFAGLAFGASQGYIFQNSDGSVTGVVQKLSSTTGIDLDAYADELAGKTLVITNMPIKVTTATLFTTPVTVRVGVASAYTEYVAATSLIGLSFTNAYTDLANLSLIPIHQTFPAGTILKLDVTVGATGTTLTGAVDVIGYLY